MIKQVRLDERLIHGQVAVKWSRILGVNRIIVADDAAASNALMQKALMMAAPNDVKVAIVDVKRAIELCQNPKSEPLSILVIVSDPEALLAFVTAVPSVGQVNIGNYGRVAPRCNGLERKALGKNLYVDDEEAALLRRVVDTGLPCVVQTVPEDVAQDLVRVLA